MRSLLDLIMPAFSGLKQDKNQKQIDILDIVYVLAIQGFVLLLLFLDNIHLPIHIAYAQEQEEGEREMATTIQSTECNILPEPGVDLAGCDLSLANLEAANLINANLVDANLEGANITNARIEGVNFTNAVTTKCIGCPS